MAYTGMNSSLQWNRRELLRAAGIGAAVTGSVVLGVPTFGEEAVPPL